MEVSVEYVIWLKSELLKINKQKLKDIKLSVNGEPVEITKQIIKNFEVTGLDNTDYITGDYYIAGVE